MNSWAVSACYPQSTFYPLSDGPSIQNHRITMTWFPTCSTRRSRSQAPLCHCTRRLVSNQAEGTFARLRYLLGVRGEHLRRRARPPARHHVDDVEVVDRPDEGQQDGDDHDVLQPRQGDVPEAVPRAGAVDRGGVVELQRDALHAREVAHAEEREASPPVRDD